MGFQLGPTGGCRRWRRTDRNLLRFEQVPSSEPQFGGRTRQQQPVSRNGGAGTIFLRASDENYGELILDNGGVASNAITPLRAIGSSLIYAITPSSLSVNASRWTPGSLIGLHVKPNVNRDELFTVTDNNATTLFTDPAEGDLSWWAPVGSTFSGVYRFDWMTVAGKAG